MYHFTAIVVKLVTAKYDQAETTDAATTALGKAKELWRQAYGVLLSDLDLAWSEAAFACCHEAQNLSNHAPCHLIIVSQPEA